MTPPPIFKYPPGVTFLHTTPDPKSPMWLFHFESLTLAMVELRVGQPNRLLVDQPTDVSANVVREFSRVLESMEVNMGNLEVIARRGIVDRLPPVILLATADGNGFALVRTTAQGISPFTGPTLAIGYLHPKDGNHGQLPSPLGILGPVWRNDPREHPISRERQLRALVQELEGPHLRLAKMLCTDPADVWIGQPDLIASTDGGPATPIF